MPNRIFLIFLTAVIILGFWTPKANGQFVYCDEDLVPVKQEESRKWGYMNFFGIWRIPPTFARAEPFNGSVAIVLIGKFYGVVNCKGKMVVQPEYTEIKPFAGGYAWVKKNSKWGLVKSTGEVVLEPVYSEVEDISRFAEQAWVKKEGNWALFDKEKEQLLTKHIYNDYQRLLETTTLVRSQGKIGVINNRTGSYVYPLKIDSVKKIAPYTMATLENGKWGLLHDNGTILLKNEYDEIKMNSRFRVEIEKNGKHGLADLRGNVVSPVKYDTIAPMQEKAMMVKADGKYGYLNFGGKEVIPLTYLYAKSFKNRQAIVKTTAGYYGIINMKNEFVLEPTYELMFRDPERNYYVGKDKGKWQFIGRDAHALNNHLFDTIYYSDLLTNVRVKNQGKVGYYDIGSDQYVFEATFDAAEPITHDLAVVSNAGKVGVYNLTGDVIVPVNYDEVSFTWLGDDLVLRVRNKGLLGLISADGKVIYKPEFSLLEKSDNATIKVRREEKYGIGNYNGSWVIEPTYEYLSNAQQDPLNVEYPAIALQKKYGLIDYKNQEALPFKYKQIKYIGGNFFAVSKNGKSYGVVNYKGQYVYPEDYSEVGNYSEKLIAFRQKGLWGYGNIKGKMNIKPQFEEATPFLKSLAVVKQDGKWGIISRSGRFSIPAEYDGFEDINGVRYLIKGGKRYSIPSLFE